MGIEPTSSAWKAEVLPLNYTRNSSGYRLAAGPLRLRAPRGSPNPKYAAAAPAHQDATPCSLPDPTGTAKVTLCLKEEQHPASHPHHLSCGGAPQRLRAQRSSTPPGLAP